MKQAEIKKRFQEGEYSYLDVFNDWSKIPVGHRKGTLEFLIEHALGNNNVKPFFDDMFKSDYLMRTDHSITQRECLQNLLVNLGWKGHYQNVLDKLEALEFNETKPFIKNNIAEVYIAHDLNEFRILKLTNSLLNALNLNDFKGIAQLVYQAFDEGHKLGHSYIVNDNDYFCLGQDTFKETQKFGDVYNLKHKDVNYKPSLRTAQSIFETRKERVKRLKELELINDNQDYMYEEGFEHSLPDEGFAYLMCMPYVEKVSQMGLKLDMESGIKAFRLLYGVANLAFHLAVKERVETQLRVHKEVFGNIDLTIYNEFHKID